MSTRHFAAVPLTLFLFLAAACGGGSGGGDGQAPGNGGGADNGAPPGDTGGINGGGRWLASGTVSSFGSVVVNGVRFETAGSTITVNGVPGTESDLAQGYVLSVRGEVTPGGASGLAEQVDFEHSLRGRIDALDARARRLVVLEQQLQVGVEAIFGASVGPEGLAALQPGDAILVSGFRDSAGVLQATRIDRDPAPGTASVIGVANVVNQVAGSLLIGALSVDYSAAMLDGFAAGQPMPGDLLLATGVQPESDQPLIASHLALRSSGLGAVPDDNVNLEGLVTRYASSADFDVAGQRVITGANTQFVTAGTAGLGLDRLVDVQGRLNEGGRLVAVRVEVIPRANIEIENARLDAIDTAAGTMRLLGIDVYTNARTRFEDDDGDQLTLAELRVGDSMAIAGYVRSGLFTAVRLARDDDDDDEVEIEGPASDLAPPEFRIGGIRILTDADTEFESDDGSLTAEEFFAMAAGRRVEVEGRWTGQVVLAEEVELDD
jgi:hypothetical protein